MDKPPTLLDQRMDRVRVVFWNTPGAELNVKEIAKRSGLTERTAYMGIHALRGTNELWQERRGRMIYYGRHKDMQRPKPV